MTVAALLWGNVQLKLERQQLNVPLVVYLSNVTFAAALSLASGFWVPVALSVLLGVIPVLVLWGMAQPGANTPLEAASMTTASVEVALK